MPPVGLVVLATGVALIGHGVWWLRRECGNPQRYWLASFGGVLAGVLGATWNGEPLLRIGAAVLGIGIALELTAYHYWDGLFTRWIWRRVEANPRLEADLKRRGIQRRPTDDD